MSHFSSSFITNKEKSLLRALFLLSRELGVGPGHFLLQRNVAPRVSLSYLDWSRGYQNLGAKTGQ